MTYLLSLDSEHSGILKRSRLGSGLPRGWPHVVPQHPPPPPPYEHTVSAVAGDASTPGRKTGEPQLSGFTQSLQANTGIVSRLVHDRILPNPFHFITRKSSNHSTLCSLDIDSVWNSRVQPV
jgi:hypothetical protein